MIEIDGFRQVWDKKLGYLLQDPDGQWYKVPVNNRIPEIDLDELEQIPPPTLFDPCEPPRKRSTSPKGRTCHPDKQVGGDAYGC